jgi:hypothetical protein
VDEIRVADRDVKEYLGNRMARFLDGGATPDVIAGALPDARVVPGLIRTLEQRIMEIAAL